MRKLLRPSDIFLLGLAGLVDVFEEIRDPLGVMAYSCQTMYGWVPEKYKKHNFVRVVERQLKTGNIEKTVKNGEVYLRLTSTGHEKIVRDFPLISLHKQKWDRKWRIVTYDIAEITRKLRVQLRNKLKELGFGKLQQSVWITPHDILYDFNEFVAENKLTEEVYLLETTHFLSGNEKELTNKIWQLDRLNDQYRELLEKIIKLKSMYVTISGRTHEDTFKYGQLKEEIDKEREKKKKDLKAEYLELVLKDPFLPKELLPKDWVGEEVRKEIGKI